jgi:energy-coupling factor transporter ATP-binding protein EcfA2/energy-coupling factor transporter transmembrane protein EcfT
MPCDLLISSLSAGIANEPPIFNELDYCFKAGTVTLVLGRSGTGKTRLIELLSGLRKPLSGEIKLGNLPLWTGASPRQKPNRQVLLQMGTAFQHPEQQLFADTIKGEFLYTLRPYQLTQDEISSRIQRGLQLVSDEAGDWLQRDPFTLSGGQQRRLSLALLEAADPDWLLLDEPTAGIDMEGASIICGQLHKRKEQGKGTIVVTHDPEAFIAVADAVLILYNGGYWQGSPSELADQPHIWCEAGLALPASLETLRTLRDAGFDVPKGWPGAAEIAAVIAAQCLRATSAKHERWLQEQTQESEISQSTADSIQLLNQPYTNPYSMPDTKLYSDKPSLSRLKQRDPRAVWLAYIIVSAGILIQSYWLGWVASLLVTLAVIRYANIPLRECLKPAAGLIVFTMLAAVISGLAIQPLDNTTPYTGLIESQGAPEVHQEARPVSSAELGNPALAAEFGENGGWVWQLPWGLLFAMKPAAETFFLLSLLVMVMLIGFVLLSGINHLRLKRALEQGLQPLKRFRVPVDQLAMAASLMIRFLPMIMDEWNRFALIAAARGKYSFRQGQIPIFRLRMTMVPILVSLLRLGEQLSLILIVRGVGQGGAQPTIAYRLLFHRLDYLFVMAAAVIGLSLGIIQYFPRIR